MKGRRETPESCPECGGDLKWFSKIQRYLCTSCGLELSPQELLFYQHTIKEEKDKVKEYVKWWLSDKKDKR